MNAGHGGITVLNKKGLIDGKLRYGMTCPGCRHPVAGHDDDGCGNPECDCQQPRETMENGTVKR